MIPRALRRLYAGWVDPRRRGRAQLPLIAACIYGCVAAALTIAVPPGPALIAAGVVLAPAVLSLVWALLILWGRDL